MTYGHGLTPGAPVPTLDRGNGAFHFKVYFAPPEFHNAAGTADRGFSAKNAGIDARVVLLPSSSGGNTKEALLPDPGGLKEALLPDSSSSKGALLPKAGSSSSAAKG
jgi:hypothetical protein